MTLISSIKYLPIKYKKHGNIRLFSNFFNRNENESKQNVIMKKINQLNEWYIKVTGLDEVKMLQNRVITTQDKLEKAQEERREVGKHLSEVRKRSTELQEQLQKVQRWQNPELFLDITREETFVIKSEKELTSRFDTIDKTEREIFTALSNAVRDSHEKEKTQSEYTKYWGIILSIAGTLVGALLSMIISSMRNRQLVNGINIGWEEKFIQLKKMITEEKAVSKETSDGILTRAVNATFKNTKMILNGSYNQIGFILQSIKSQFKKQQRLLGHLDEIKKIVKTDDDTNKSEGYGISYKIYLLGAALLFLIVMSNK